MSDNLTAPTDAELSSQAPDEATFPDEKTTPWLTFAAIAISSLILITAVLSNPDALDRLGRLGVDTRGSVLDVVVALIGSAFVHPTFWHFGVCMYWLWQLGHRLEDALGWGRYLGFFLLAAIFSSFVELIISGTTGIGMSGVLYAMVGFMWVARFRFIHFQEILGGSTIGAFLGWMFFAIILTAAEVAYYGNGANVSGLAFGAGVAYLYRLNGEAPEQDEDEDEVS